MVRSRTYLLQRQPRLIPVQAAKEPLEHLVEERDAGAVETAPVGEDVEAYALLKHLVLLAVVSRRWCVGQRRDRGNGLRCRPTSAR